MYKVIREIKEVRNVRDKHGKNDFTKVSKNITRYRK